MLLSDTLHAGSPLLIPHVMYFRSIRPEDGEADPVLQRLHPGDETRAVPHSNRCLPLHHGCHSGKCRFIYQALLRHDTLRYSTWRRSWILTLNADYISAEACFKSQDSRGRCQRSTFRLLVTRGPTFLRFDTLVLAVSIIARFPTFLRQLPHGVFSSSHLGGGVTCHPCQARSGNKSLQNSVSSREPSDSAE